MLHTLRFRGSPCSPEVLVLQQSPLSSVRRLPSKCLPCKWGLEASSQGVPEGRTPPAASCVALEKQGEESGQALTRHAGLIDGAPAGAPVTAQPCVGAGTVPPHGSDTKAVWSCGPAPCPRWRRWVGPKPRAMPPHRRALTKPLALGGVLLPPGEWGRHSGHRAGWLSGLTPGSRWACGMGTVPGFALPHSGALAGIIRCPRSRPDVTEGLGPWHSLGFWHTPGIV